MKRALITGIDGFTGRYVAAELEAHGWEVWGTGLREIAQASRYVTVDLMDLDSLKAVVAKIRPDAVVHLAAIAFVAHVDGDELYGTNLIGSRNLLLALKDLPYLPERVILASSANVYGNSPGILSESAPLAPANDYAVSKLAMEYMARLWFDVFPIVIARPFNYTGVGQAEHFLLPKIVSHARKKSEVIELGNLDVWRDFSDVRFVAMAYRRLLEVRVQGEIVNICSGRVHSLREIVDMVQSITGHHMRVEVNPAFVRESEVRRLAGDPGKLKKLIGESQTPSLDSTLRWMLA